MPFTEASKSTYHVLGHELVHAFQYDIARQDKIGGISATSKLPLWFIEGMAQYLSIGPRSAQTAMYLRDAVFYDDMPAIKDLTRGSEYFPYRYAHALWAFVGGIWGDEVIADLYRAPAKKGVKKGFKQVLEFSVDSVSTMWQQAVKNKYANDVEKVAPPDSIGKLVRGKSTHETSLNVAPSLSPNGKYVASGFRSQAIDTIPDQNHSRYIRLFFRCRSCLDFRRSVYTKVGNPVIRTYSRFQRRGKPTS